MKNLLIICFLIIIGVSNTYADDWIVMIDNSIVKCKVIEIEQNHAFISKNETEQKIPLALIKKIYYENGETIYIGGNQRRNIRPFGLGINALGSTLVYGSVYANYYLSPKVNFELGTDLMSVYSGFNFFPLIKEKDRMFTPYIGAFLSYTYDNVFDIADLETGVRGYFPIGIQLFLESGVVFSAEIAFTTSYNYEIGPIYGGLKLSYQISRN